MNNLTIKGESLPERCEICHQTDCFTAQFNYCSRCNNVLKNVYPHKNLTDNYYLSIGVALIKVITLLLSIVIVFIISFYLTILPFSEYGPWQIKNPIIWFLLFIVFIAVPILFTINFAKYLFKQTVNYEQTL